MAQPFDVIVVGAGHAGCEAALAAARLGLSTLMLTMSRRTVASMPCNPSIGGPAKGHLVREIDALGGEMGINADETCMQMRMLNTGKGPAVQALRAQSDRFAYSRRMLDVIERQSNLELREALVVELLVQGGRVRGVVTSDGSELISKAVVLTTGVYMNARVFVGERNKRSGPRGQKTTGRLSQSLADIGFELVRFKTGTPARVRKSSVAYDALEPLDGDVNPERFSYLSPPLSREQARCWITYTTPATHEIIRANLHRASMYSGAITGPGPRYCPSIEAKLVMFEKKERHQIFVEPEGWSSQEMYLSGLGTSLPQEVQEAFLRTIPGLENAVITRFGYAIEYDAMTPTQMDPSLMTKDVEGLFCAGQINGTTGYEEAAAQGLVAGVNASRYVRGQPPLVLDRSQAYIGVLIDDLVTKGTSEPYRMMTSRAEYRLLLRHDNADHRLTPIGREIGLVTDERYARFEERWAQVNAWKDRLAQRRVGSGERERRALEAIGTRPLKGGGASSLADLLKRPEVTIAKLAQLDEALANVDPGLLNQVEIEIKYEGYITRQAAHVERFQRMESKLIPKDVDYQAIPGLSTEGREKLSAVRPRSVGQAARIAGVSPADISVLLIHMHSARTSPQEEASVAHA